MPASWKFYCSCIQQRWLTTAMCFLANFNSFTMRLCLSIAITEMVPSKHQAMNSTDNTCRQFGSLIKPSEVTPFQTRTFEWDEKMQGLILSSFSWGFIVSSFLGGTVVNKYGSKCTLAFSFLSTSILTLLTPLTIEWGGPTGLIILRMTMGLTDGTLEPSLMKLMAHWIPEDERSRTAAWTFSGVLIGTCAGTAGSGFIIQRSEIGWPAAFYFNGTLGIVSFLILCGLCYNSPSEHPFVSEAEKVYLAEKLKYTHKDLPPTPWRHILRSKPTWALQIGKIGKTWSMVTLTNDMPKFMKSFLNVSVETNGYMTSIPYVASWIFSLAASWLADFAVAKKIASIGFVRKIGNSIAMVGTWLVLIAATYVGCDRNVVFILHVVAMIMYGCANFGVLINALDLAPNYASGIQGVQFGVTNSTGFLIPYIVGLMTPNQSLNEWRHVFWLLFAICATTNAIFVLYGSGEVQRWNEPAFLRRQGWNEKSDAKADFELLRMK